MESVYGDKVKTTYGHIINYFGKFFVTVSQVLILVNKLR